MQQWKLGFLYFASCKILDVRTLQIVVAIYLYDIILYRNDRYTAYSLAYKKFSCYSLKEELYFYLDLKADEPVLKKRGDNRSRNSGNCKKIITR